MNYPGGIKKTNNHLINYKNRGMNLEDDLNQSNHYYKEKNIAYIYKKPTPIRVSKVDFKGKSAIIKEAFYMEPSTTDYNGIYKGHYIEFDAKECKTDTFPLQNIHEHQVTFMKNFLLLIFIFTNLNI